MGLKPEHRNRLGGWGIWEGYFLRFFFLQWWMVLGRLIGITLNRGALNHIGFSDVLCLYSV